MHIAFRTSKGRGEFELVGRQGTLHTSDLLGWRLSWQFPNLDVHSSGLHIEPGGSGKARLRRHPNHPKAPQVGRQMGSQLLLRPMRKRIGLDASTVVSAGRNYLLSKVGLGAHTEAHPDRQTLVVSPVYVELKNTSHEQTVWVAERLARLQELHETVQNDELPQLPREIRKAIELHQDCLYNGPLSSTALGASRRTFKWLDALTEAPLTSDAAYVRDLVLGLENRDNEHPTLIPDLDDLAPDDIAKRMRITQEMRVSNIRGTSGRRFSVQVREAWNYACAFCGLNLPKTEFLDSGVDAAHILPWATYELDKVNNGICLCKLHHWAFDSMLLRIRPAGESYEIEETELLSQLGQRERTELGRVVGPIPDERLPRDPAQRPHPKFIELLYEKLDPADPAQ